MGLLSTLYGGTSEGGGGGGLAPKFQEFNSSGTFTPSQELIDAGGYIEVFLVAGGASGPTYQLFGGNGGEVIIKSMYLTSTSNISVTVGAAGDTNGSTGGSSVFSGASAGGSNITALGGVFGPQMQRLGAGWGTIGGGSNTDAAAGNGTLGYGAGGGDSYNGIVIGKANSGQGAAPFGTPGSGYCLVKWYE
jgi:hypothetical protein